MSSLESTWDQLARDGDSGSGYVRLRLGEISSCSTYAARGLADKLEALIIEVNTESLSSKIEFPDATGFSIRVVSITPGRMGRTRVILSLTNSKYRDVFLALATDVAKKLADTVDERGAVKSLVSRLTRWQSFLRRHGIRGLSHEERRGLFGELVLLKEHVIPNMEGRAAVESWKGCRGKNHDFQFPLGSIEVKTTSANTPHAFHVSNVKQLDSPGQGRLFIYFVLLEESEAGVVSLPDMVDSVRKILDDAAALNFDDSLVEAGYLEAQRSQYKSPRYTVRRTRFFAVTNDFPRVREGSLADGVEEVRYQVALSACTRFEVQPTDVQEAILSKAGAVS